MVQMARKDIIQELNALGSSLAGTPSQNVYSVPEGYFEAFASSVFSKINVENEQPLFESEKSNPYKVPVGYFENLTESVLDKIRKHPDYLNSQEELELISPLLNSLKKEPVFSVPQDYFENFTVALNQKPAASSGQPAKVVSMFNRKMMRYAAVAVITLMVGTTGWMIYKNNHKTPEQRIISGLNNDVRKINDVKQLDNLAEFMDAGLNEKEVATTKIKSNDVEKLLKDVSVDELNEFSEESKDIQDVMMTN